MLYFNMIVVIWSCPFEMSCQPKYNLIVEEVELLEINSLYAHIFIMANRQQHHTQI